MYSSTTDKIALWLIVIGALNWLFVGIFEFDAVAYLFGGSTSMLSKILYSIIGIAGIYSASLFFRQTETSKQ